MTKHVGLIVVGLAASLWMGGTQTALAQVAAGVITPDSKTNFQSYERFRRTVDGHRVDGNLSDQAIHESAGKIAECIARRGGDKAGDYLGGGLAGDPDYARLGKALTGKLRACANGESTATAAAISGVLAEQLLALKAPAFEDRAVGVNALAAREFYGDLNGQVTFDTIAGCLAVYSPGLTYKLVQSEAGSEAETAALTAVFAQTPECNMSTPPTSMVPAATQRATLATALYEWTVKQS